MQRKIKVAAKDFLYRLSVRTTQARYWLTAQVARALLSALRHLPSDKALNFADRTARRLGPLVGRHKVALENLRHAYPEKSEAEIEAIALDMWGNMARLAAEYIFLDQLFDYDPDAKEPGRVEVSGVPLFQRIAAEDKPHIIFTGHLGNFELLPIAGATYGLKVTALFRPPNNPYIADYILSTRRANMGDLLASQAGASFTLARLLEKRGTIGMLVDQKFTRGIRSTFFGRPCETSPLLPKLVRQFDCDVYPARCIRLPNNRFRLEIEDKLELPRSASGTIDLAGTAQILNDVVERWVREDPGQWMWFHKRWQLSKGKRKPRFKIIEKA
ncbi:lipid A biosynthesis lauroyl acyltransferase [Pseudaminobacter soli (ex Li et al. 2025)]|uniref:Lipid A biosynthesis lauroyl acyltransferase n=1 Tax=Pseudaminobacter soli (ex Li et al. 2025) TaxID=1295366 RepID=A0A2P7SN04_9HYPH|nr:lipid A biosynthesis lauroyl acyltransferase [Mesorhizobium soli]PSJ63874.1 lipid A biosynthesis lauroyl acyltransferase [Mesorhizobium soli]